MLALELQLCIGRLGLGKVEAGSVCLTKPAFLSIQPYSALFFRAMGQLSEAILITIGFLDYLDRENDAKPTLTQNPLI